MLKLFAYLDLINLIQWEFSLIIFGVREVLILLHSLQTVLFLTDSVFYVLFAYFDESMSSIGGYEP